jgi:hypothetical protein
VLNRTMDHASASFASPWAAAVLGGHAMGAANTEHGFGHHGLSTMDLHGYSYYRCEDAETSRFFLFDSPRKRLVMCPVIYGALEDHNKVSRSSLGSLHF